MIINVDINSNFVWWKRDFIRVLKGWETHDPSINTGNLDSRLQGLSFKNSLYTFINTIYFYTFNLCLLIDYFLNVHFTSFYSKDYFFLYLSPVRRPTTGTCYFLSHSLQKILKRYVSRSIGPEKMTTFRVLRETNAAIE